jgi:hypothetical protein
VMKNALGFREGNRIIVILLFRATFLIEFTSCMTTVNTSHKCKAVFVWYYLFHF